MTLLARPRDEDGLRHLHLLQCISSALFVCCWSWLELHWSNCSALEQPPVPLVALWHWDVVKAFLFVRISIFTYPVPPTNEIVLLWLQTIRRNGLIYLGGSNLRRAGKCELAGYFGAGWGQFNCLHTAPTCLVVHQSSSRKVRTTIFYKIGVRETLWSKDHQSPMVNFSHKLGKIKSPLSR